MTAWCDLIGSVSPDSFMCRSTAAQYSSRGSLPRPWLARTFPLSAFPVVLNFVADPSRAEVSRSKSAAFSKAWIFVARSATVALPRAIAKSATAAARPLPLSGDARFQGRVLILQHGALGFQFCLGCRQGPHFRCPAPSVHRPSRCGTFAALRQPVFLWGHRPRLRPLHWPAASL